MGVTGHALVVGAGVGGLTAALRLARSGWRVSVFESAPVLEEVGAGLQLSPNATSILGRLGVLGRIREASLAPRALVVLRARDGAALARMPLDDAERRWGACYLLAHRADLQKGLLAAAAAEPAITVRLGVEVGGLVSQHAAGVVATLREGSSRFEVAGDCLIGADGSRSRVRAAMLGGPDVLNLSRRSAWRALVPADRAPAEALRPEACLWLGRKAHLVHYPLRGGSVINLVAVVEEEGPVADRGPFWANDADDAELTRVFSDWDARARALIGGARSWRKWRLHDREPLASWSSGRVALLGDAAHPVLPFLAQGAAQSIEDAEALGRALDSGARIEAALESYGRSRLPRASRVQMQSRAQERLYHLSGPAATARDLALRALGGDRLLARYDWLYAAGAAAS